MKNGFVTQFEKKFFKFDNVVEFHFALMNIVMLVREKYEEGGCYCFCDSYRECCCFPLIKCFFRQRRPRFCTLCKMQTFFYKKDAIDRMCVLEFLDRHSEDELKINQLAKLIWPFIRKIYFLRREYLEFFDDEYVWTHRDWNTFKTSRVSHHEIIDYDKELIRLNGPERYFTFTYGR